MTPHVREAEVSPIAVTPTPRMMVPVNAVLPTAGTIDAKAKTPATNEEQGQSTLGSRRRRWARLSNRR